MTTDLSTLASGQLHAALAKYQQAVAEGEAIPRPSAFGLALSHYQSAQGIGCFLLHESGALLDSGPVVAPTVLEAAQRAAALVTGAMGSALLEPASVSAQKDGVQQAPTVVQQARTVSSQTVEPPAQTVEPEPEPQRELGIASVTADAIAHMANKALDLMDELHTQSPDALKSLIVSYKEKFNIGRTPMPKSITTPERAQFLLDALGA